jgi:ABC-type transporter Mla MlaB component
MGVRLFYKRKLTCRRLAERSPLWFWDIRSLGRVDVGAVALLVVLIVVVNGGHTRDVRRLQTHARETLCGMIITSRR